MLIDWFTVGAQVLNFVILIWLMKRFLYKPILNAIDSREKKIAAELADADKKKAEAQKDSEDFQHKNEEFDQQRAALLKKATDDAKTEREQLLDEARKAADALSVKRHEALIKDANRLNEAITHRTQEEVFSIARKALADLATTSLEERICDVFMRRLGTMDERTKAGLAASLKAESDPVLVRSAFALTPEQCAAMQKALNETFATDIHLRFETAPDIISGIELIMNGQKLGWSIADYLASLEKGVDALLKAKDTPAAKVVPKPKAEPKFETAAEAKSP